jgi:alpha-D-ribose 1-methylphosphonate 5-triphosphate diphosphatase
MKQAVQITNANGGVSLGCADGRIVEHVAEGLTFDATGLDLLPGLIDVHGDAFERAVQPRAGVAIPVPIALAELEAGLLAAGITTAYLAITLSWEAGLRSRATYEALRDAIAARPAGRVPDLKLHIRFEAHNLDCLELAIADIGAGHIGMLSFNDHTPAIMRKLPDRAATAKYTDRAGQSFEAFAADAARAAAAPAAEVAAARARLAAAAREAGIPMASHDDPDVATREAYRALGARISEFPMSDEVARDAVDAGEHTVMGAPNVVRGGSHVGWHGAEALVRQRLCSVLCSDYHYPSMLAAIYRIARNGSADFDAAVALVTRNAARMSKLADRGELALGRRADLVLVSPGEQPHVVATIAGGKLAFLAPGAMERIK